MNLSHHEPHFINRNGWLRASVLGANDGLISTASLLIGVVAANVDDHTLILTGLAALIGGAISMASGEYVSVSSQADTEKADLAKEAYELEHNADRELKELTAIYKMRGLDENLATQVAVALTQHNALEAHARDEMGLTETGAANPLQAALASAGAFVLGAILPVLCVWLLPTSIRMVGLGAITLIGLAVLGWLSATLGGAKPVPAVMRILLWGVIALVATSLIGKLLGVQVA